MQDRINKLLELIAQQPSDSFLRHALALEYVKTGDDGLAREQFETLLENDPGYVGSYYHLARLLERAGASKEAMAVYEKGIEIAKKAGDMHARNELQMALDDLAD